MVHMEIMDWRLARHGVASPAKNSPSRFFGMSSPANHFIRCLWAVAGLASLVTTGCGPSGPPRVPAPPLNAAQVTWAIMSLADTNGDGVLDSDELAKVPSLKPIRSELDTSSDGKLSAAEIEAWLTRIAESRMAVGIGAFKVTQKGRPLANVAVKLVPEPFMGGGMKAAEGETDSRGVVNPTIPGSEYHGVHFGLYRVELVGNGADGKPLPEKYNTVSEIGIGFGLFDDQAFWPELSLD